MPQYSDVKLAEKMSKVSKRLAKAASLFDCNLEYASVVYADIAIPSYASGTEEIIVREDNMLESFAYAHQNLKEFDKNLSKLLALRLQLAEETGIPMNLSGGREWVRLVEHSM